MKYLIPILLAIIVVSSGCEQPTPVNKSKPEKLDNCGDLVSHDGYDYSTVLIGEQCWFSENCRYLPEVSPSSAYLGSETEPYYYVFNYQGTDVAEAKATANYETYGVLYNLPALMTEGICPSGWHIPSDEEWTQLTDFLGENAGYQMKSTSGWDDGGNGSNSSGFNGLPGGQCYYGGVAGNGEVAVWWSAERLHSDLSLDTNRRRRMGSRSDNVDRSLGLISNGYSARCVRD